MSITVKDLERTVNSGLTTAIKKSEINFNQLFIYIDIEDLASTVLFLKTNNKCRFRQLIDITAVDYPQKEKRFKVGADLVITPTDRLPISKRTDTNVTEILR